MHTKAKTMKIYTGETMEDFQLLGLDLHVHGLVVVGNATTSVTRGLHVDLDLGRAG